MLSLKARSLGYVSVLMLCNLCHAPVWAGTEDDADWVSRCVTDNRKEGQSVETVTAYCNCMNAQMAESETRSITEWEKTHPKEEAQCSEKAGWKE